MNSLKIISLIVLIFIFSIFYSCSSNSTEIKKEKYFLISKFKLDSDIKFVGVQNAAFGHTYTYPDNFEKINLTKGKERLEAYDLGRIKFVSKDKKVILKHWIYDDEYKITSESSLEKKIDAVKNYYKSLLKGKDYHFKDAKIVESGFTFDTYPKNKIRRKNEIWIIAEKGEKVIIWKSIFLETPPVSDYKFVNMTFEYEKSAESYYNPIGIRLANDFSDYFMNNFF